MVPSPHALEPREDNVHGRIVGGSPYTDLLHGGFTVGGLELAHGGVSMVLEMMFWNVVSIYHFCIVSTS
jgi:hypothetical protein